MEFDIWAILLHLWMAFTEHFPQVKYGPSAAETSLNLTYQ